MTAYTLTFSSSTSPNYSRAVDLASHFPGYAVDDEGRGMAHAVPLVLDHEEDFDDLIELVAAVRGWRATFLSVDGVRMPRRAVHDLMAVLDCYRQYVVAGTRELYCRGLPERPYQRLPCRLVDLELDRTVGNGIVHSDDIDALLDGVLRTRMITLCPALFRRTIAEEARRLNDLGPPRSPRTPRLTPGERSVDDATLDRLLDDVDLGDDSPGPTPDP